MCTRIYFLDTDFVKRLRRGSENILNRGHNLLPSDRAKPKKVADSPSGKSEREVHDIFRLSVDAKAGYGKELYNSLNNLESPILEVQQA